MTILTLNRKELESKIGKITPEIEEKIAMFGTPVDSSTAREISIEVFPNRPDLLSLQGFARSFLQYLGKKAIAKYTAKKPKKDYKIKVEASVKKVRPYTTCAIVKGLKLNNEKIKEIVNIQEKLHLTIGRKRKKLAIGIYPLEKIKLPIKYTAKKPEDILFRPLEMNKELNGKQILRQHPAGREYAHLLQDQELFPVFIDADNKVLSVPPIINSHETGKITEKTKEIFIEFSGHNLEALKKALNIIVAVFEDMGGKVYAMDISDEKNITTPDLEFEKLEFKIEDINKTLGLELNEKQIKSYLEKMGIGVEKDKEKLIALIPAYRTDILHWIDLTEEVAIAYGYDKFKPEIPEISTIGEEDQKAVIKRKLAEILSGLNLLEVSSYHLTTKQDIKKMHFNFKDFIEVEDSKTEFSVLRNDLLSNSLKILSENSDSTYPQKIFEIGKIFELSKSGENPPVQEKEKLAVVLTDEKINFTDLKQVLDYLFKMLDKTYEIKETENSNFIKGRVANIFVEGKEIGVIGEIAPRVIKNWKLKNPVVGLELDLGWLF